jgi:peptidoglycan/xylan/chitin deacetylase (PgdA/CDA1 family)
MKIKFALFAERLLSIALYYSGLLSLYRMKRKRKVIFLTYHRVRPDDTTDIKKGELQILSKGNFERHISYLSRHCNIISLGEFVGMVKSRRKFPKNSVVITFDDGYKDNFTNAYPVLKKYDAPATVFLITGRIGSSGFLTWEDVNKMKDLVDFGAHTVNHPILTSLTLKHAEGEIRNSKKDLEKRLGKDVDFFCYPSGGQKDCNDTVKRLVKEAGFSCAVTTMNGDNGHDADLFELKRIGMSHENSFTVFRVKSSGMLNSLLRLAKGRVKISVGGHVPAGRS